MELKQSNKYEVQVPREEMFVQIPVQKWESLKIEVDRIDPAGRILPSLVGGLLGFWLSTLVFSYPRLVQGQNDLFWAFSLLWAGSVGVYYLIYRKQRELIGNVKAELKEIINEVDK